jgi:hypothetical protein
MNEKALLFFAIVVMFSGCGKKYPLEKKYLKEFFYGQWQGKTIIIADRNNMSNAIMRSRIENYGSIQCAINPNNTYKFNLVITNDVYERDSLGKIDYGHLIINSGYKLLTTGRFVYQDSIASFYNYRDQKELGGVLYNYENDLYLIYDDKNHHEWNIQFERTN